MSGMVLLAAASACNTIKLYCNPDAQTVLAVASEATISQEAREQNQSISVYYDVKNSNGNGRISYKFRKPNQERLDYVFENDAEVFCLNGKKSWIFDNGKIQDMTDEDKEAVKQALELAPFTADFLESLTNEKLEADDVAAGEKCYVISGNLAGNNNEEVKIWISKDSYLLQQISYVSEDEKYTIQFFDYVELNGVQLAKSIYTYTANDADISYYELKEIEFNQLDEDSFARPTITTL